LFVMTYVYKVSQEQIDKFLIMEKKATNTYLKHGCLGLEILRSADGLCMEINRFESRGHYQSVSKSLDSDPEMQALWKEFRSIIGNQDIVTVEYEQIL